MPHPRTLRMSPVVERLDARLVLNAAIPVPTPTTIIPRFTPADLQGFANAYLATRGQVNYNPAYDFNNNGFIGQGDVKPILRGLASITPRVPLRVIVHLAPGEQVTGHHPANSGGVTRAKDVTIEGKTTPNSIIFTDAPANEAGSTDSSAFTSGDYKFEGQALVADSQGNWSYTLELSAALTQTEYLILDPFGHQTIHAFPILRLA